MAGYRILCKGTMNFHRKIRCKSCGTYMHPTEEKICEICEAEYYLQDKEIYELLSNEGFKVLLDDRNEKLGYKIRESIMKKYKLLKELPGISIGEYIQCNVVFASLDFTIFLFSAYS